MSEAWISARAGYAVVLTPEDCFLLEAGRPTPPQVCPRGQLSNLKALASDVLHAPAGAFPFPEVRQVLDVAWRQESALTLLLTALDPDLSSGVRAEAAEVAERLLADEEVHAGVRNRLLSAPFPEIADVEGARLGAMAEFLVTEARYNRIQVGVVSLAWEQTAFQSRIPISSGELAQLRRWCVLHGWFASLVTSLRRGEDAWLTLLQRLKEASFLSEDQTAFLREWAVAAQKTHERLGNDSEPALASPYVAPNNMLEERIATIWQEVLGVELVGVSDDFFELGGDSLTAIHMMSRLRSEFQSDLPAHGFFEAPITVRTLAETLAEVVEVSSEEEPPKRDLDWHKREAKEGRLASRHWSRRH